MYLCKSFLNNIYEKVDVIVTLTKEDGAYIRNRFQSVAGKIVTIPVVFDFLTGRTIGDDSRMEVFDKKHARELLFWGNLYHRPNLEALEWFLRECAPHLDRGFTLHLCGMDGPINNIKLPEDHITIIRHGYVEDIGSEIGYRDGEEAIIRSTGISMARELNAIAKDPGRIFYIGNNASRKVKEEFSPETSWKYYRNGVFNQQMVKTG